MPAGGAPLRGDLLRRAASHDAFRATAVSLPFRAADAVWAFFQPPGLPPLSDWELSPEPLSKGALFKLLSERPVLLADGFTHVAGQGDRHQILHAVGEGPVHRLGRYATVLELDPSH